jgi:hypothetical protein
MSPTSAVKVVEHSSCLVVAGTSKRHDISCLNVRAAKGGELRGKEKQSPFSDQALAAPPHYRV